MSAVLYDALERAVKVLQQHPELPPTTTVSQTEDALWVNPYVLGAPLTAILGWHDAMREQEREFQLVTNEAGNYTTVTVRGFLEDIPVVAQTVTFQELNGQRGRITLAELRRAAGAEEEILPVTS